LLGLLGHLDEPIIGRPTRDAIIKVYSPLPIAI